MARRFQAGPPGRDPRRYPDPDRSASPARGSVRRGRKGGPGRTRAPIKRAGGMATVTSSKRHEQEVDASTKRTVLTLLGLAALLMVVGWGAFSYFVPHTQVELQTVWHEAWSGKFVQSSVENKGTHDLTELQVTLSVWNGTELMNSRSQGQTLLEPGQMFDLEPFQFYGESVETFTVVLEVTFLTNGQEYSPTFSYQAKDYQNHNWRETIFEWG